MSSADLVNAQPAGYEDDCDLDDLSFVEDEPSTAKKHEGNSGIGEGSSKDDSKRVGTACYRVCDDNHSSAVETRFLRPTTDSLMHFNFMSTRFLVTCR